MEPFTALLQRSLIISLIVPDLLIDLCVREAVAPRAHTHRLTLHIVCLVLHVET